ncbi:AAA family ATPase [Chromobacterium phragmitis]|uniref:AAA family ATPase n=1 Tax=Chromobacterium phragmitis TaxID=2202141 RepID=A0ABV0J0X9_9NEIS
MKILDLHINNFLTIGSARLNLADKGLVLVQGVNEDDSSAESNGAGKSSIVDALSWALYGKTARGEAGDRVVNRTAKRDCRVSVRILDGDNVVRIERHRKHKEFKNSTLVYLEPPEDIAASAGDPAIALHKGTEAETQLVIEEIIGSSYEVFCAAVYAGQENMPDIPNMTDKQLKSLVEEAAGITRLERAYEVAKTRRADADGAVKMLQVKVEAVAANATRAEGRLAELQDHRDAWEAGRSGRVAEVRGRAAEVSKRAAALVAVVKARNIGEKTARRAEVQGAIDSLKPAAAAYEAAQRAERDAERKLTLLQAEYDRLAGAAKHTKAEIDALASGMPCKSCGALAPADKVDEIRGRFTTQLRNEVSAAGAHKRTIEEAEAALRSAREATAAAKAAIPDTAALTSELAALDAEIAADHADRAQVASLVDAAKRENAEAERLQGEANPMDAMIDSAKTEKARIDAELAELRGKLHQANADLDIAECVAKVFGPAGVRAHILDTVTPFLNERTADYLSVLSDGNISAIWSTLSTTAKGELREKFIIDVTNDKGAETFAGLSGGEKRKVRLSCMLALQDLVSARASKPIDLWVGDEVDDAMDAGGLERLMTILERKARERGTVLVVSHSDLKDWAEQVAIVRKSGGYSHVEGALTV